MKQEKSDISLLLVILVLFSASIGLLHGFKITLISASEESQRITLSEQDMLDLLQPALLSKNMAKVAEGIMQFDEQAQQALVHRIVEPDSKVALDDMQKITLLAALAAQKSNADRDALFALLAAQFADEPVLASVVADYPKLIGAVQAWAKKEGKQELYNTWKNKSIVHAVQMNDVPLLTKLYTQGVRLSPEEASIVLDRVVTEKRDASFVPLLVRKFGAGPHYSADGKRTVLIKAVETNAPDMVRALLDEGADANHIVDATVGSAAQKAMEHGFIEIERILKKH